MTSSEGIGRALGRITSGLYVVTTGNGDQKTGILASWIMQAGFNPPTVTIALQRNREILTNIEDSRGWVINILSGSNSNIMGRFTKYKQDQFEGLEHYENSFGVVLVDTVAFISCRLLGKWDVADHWVLYGEVCEGDILSEHLLPWSHVRKSGFVY